MGYLTSRRSERLRYLSLRNTLSPKSNPSLKRQICHPSLKSKKCHLPPKSKKSHQYPKSQRSHPPLISQKSHLQSRCPGSHISLRNFFFYLLLFYFPVSSYSQRVFTAGAFIMLIIKHVKNIFDSPLTVSAVLWFSIIFLFSREN